jgi:hypothetical protein
VLSVIDGNKFNNVISNLRWATTQENQFNRAISSNNTSGVKGVSWNKRAGKWRAHVKINQQEIHLGYFDNLVDATECRRQKANELFGNYIHACEV